MKQKDIVIGESYYSPGVGLVVVLDVRVPRDFWHERPVERKTGVAVAYRSFDGWIPTVLSLNQIQCTWAEHLVNEEQVNKIRQENAKKANEERAKVAQRQAHIDDALNRLLGADPMRTAEVSYDHGGAIVEIDYESLTKLLNKLLKEAA